VKVVWLNAWFDPGKERDAAMALMNQGADVLAFHTASTAVMAAAQERGKLAIAYHSDMRKAAPDAQVLAVTHQWGDYYKRRTQAVLDGTWKSGNVWGGVKEGMIRVGWFGPRCPRRCRTRCWRARRTSPPASCKPFAGPDRDNAGQARCCQGQAMTDAQILAMNFLVSGVQGKIRTIGGMQAFRAALLRFADDGSALYDEDGLLVIGPGADGRKVVRAAGAYGSCRQLSRRAVSTCPAASWRPASSTCTCTSRRPT
jgi:hypothetical protein